MTPKQLQISDYFCRGCHMPHSLDADMLCEFCRSPKGSLLEIEDLDGVPLIVYALFAAGILAVIVGIYFAAKI